MSLVLLLLCYEFFGASVKVLLPLSSYGECWAQADAAGLWMSVMSSI